VNFDFSDDQLAIRDAVEAICADFGADYWLERDGRWPGEFYEAVARGGWFGGLGFAQEYHVERGLRESVLPLLAPVTQELALCYVAEQALGLPKSY
jgi:alkylation response protein AidB-like acyl-CoA dehydrogenase